MYVDAFHDKKNELIKVVERVDGKRVYKEFLPDWHFYIDDPKGTSKTIYGKPVKRIQPSSYTERRKLLAQYRGAKLESDMNPLFRCFEQEYTHFDTPVLNVAFYDIETDYNQIRGYSSPEEAFNPITSIAIYLQWMDVMVCLAVPPKTLTWEKAQVIAKDVGEEVVLFRTEKEMLEVFINIIEDADVISGWNSALYDIPYTINRVIKLLGRSETRKFCLWNNYPKVRRFERGGKEYPTYDLIGRVHLDYLDLYKKYSYEERHSYTLNSIAEEELGEKKVEYNGTLDQLYNNDFKKFLRYNIQDTALLDKLDKKLQYIDLCSTIAHANCVALPTTMGSVATIDQAVVMEAHQRGLVVPNKSYSDEEVRAAGGWVAQPKRGLHKWIGSSDLNSLYPAVIRSLNMSPETIIGQINLNSTNVAINVWEAATAKNTFATWWNDRFFPLEMDCVIESNNHDKLLLEMEDGNSYNVTGAEVREIVFDGGHPWCISANGTIFRTDIEGVVPGLLTRWYSERKLLQAIKGMYGTLEDNEKSKGIIVPAELFINDDVEAHVHHASPFDHQQCYKPDKLLKLIEAGHKKRVVEYMNQHTLMVKDGKVTHRDQSELKKIIGFWDKRQLVKKILLNSAYGALLNAGSRFFDQRIGQSTTLTGRNITKHMAAKTNEYITGEYDHYGSAIIYGDTDSEVGSTLHHTSWGEMPIEDMFNKCENKWSDGDKEYASDEELMVMSYDNDIDEPYMGHTNFIYRHKVTKDLYEIQNELGDVITVTEDHSVMIERNGILQEVKPFEITTDDIIVSMINS